MSIYPSRKEALETGSKLYTGAPCKKCGSRVRYTSTSNCKECAISRGKAIYKDNKSQQKKYYAENADKIRKRNREYKKKYRKSRPDVKRAEDAKRRADKINRTPSWANLSDIKNIYSWARLASVSTGVEHHVDHVIPLKGKTVSGLHVETNLSVVPYWENLEKNNKF